MWLVHQHGVSLPDPTIVGPSRPAVNEAWRAAVEGQVRGAVAVVCAVSAGVHAALVPPHLQESRLLGAGFAMSALALGVCALVVRRRGGPVRTVAAVLLTVAAAYVLSRTTGLPVLIPHPEHVDVLGVLTTVVEAAAAIAVLCLPAPRKEPR